MIGFDVIREAADVLGESPLWCVRRERLFWVDIRAPALQSCDANGAEYRRWTMPSAIGSFAFTGGDHLIVALRDGFHRFDPSSGRLAPIALVERDRPHHRMNEGKCDPQGRFVAGSMNDSVREATGLLYQLGPGSTCEVVKRGFAVPNSLCWSPEGDRVYFADTEARVIVRYRYDAAGALLEPAAFVDLRSGAGRPDGATIDAEGCLWSAEVASGCVVRYTPDGRELARFDLPVSRVTSLTFGGPGHATLYVTTSSYKLTSAQRAEEPLAGALFAASPGVQGLPAAVFAG